MKTKRPHISSQDYSPFGVTLSGRGWSEGYRYGFNGKEKDRETFSGAYDFGARLLDVRLGRWLSLDMCSYRAPSWTVYRSFFNSPISCTDATGNFEVDPILLKYPLFNAFVNNLSKGYAAKSNLSKKK